MKKVKISIAGVFIIINVMTCFVFAAEVKDAPVTSRANVNIVPTATPAVQTRQQSAAVNATPDVLSTQTQPQLTLTPVDNYTYNPVGKPDPFRPFVTVDVAVAKQQLAKKAEVSMFPLQRAEAEKYRIVGIAGNKDHRVAICEDAAKKFYPLYVGTHIGLYNGKVIEILPDRVIVEEYEEKKPRRVILKLRKN